MCIIPTEENHYWATHVKYGWRRIVLLKRNGVGHLRAYVAWFTSSFGVEEFKDWSKPIVERTKRKK